jgi:RNA recognition motif-containing protein
MAAKLYVGGLNYSTTSDQLRAHFAQCGTVVSAAVVTERDSAQSRGFGFVEMSTDAEAEGAIAQLNQQPLDGKTLTVNAARSRLEKSGPRGDRAPRF